MGSPNSPCTWLQRMTVNIKQQQLDKNVFLDHAKSSFQTWEKTASMLSVEFHNPLISSAHSHPSNTLHCIPWHSQSCHSKSPGAEGGWGAPASQGCDTGLALADVWPHHMNHDCLTSSTRPGSSLSAESVIQDLQRKHFFFFFLQLIRFAACKANFKRWAVPDADEKVCACSVTQGVWPRFSFTTELMQHLYECSTTKTPNAKSAKHYHGR